MTTEELTAALISYNGQVIDWMENVIDSYAQGTEPPVIPKPIPKPGDILGDLLVIIKRHQADLINLQKNF